MRVLHFYSTYHPDTFGGAELAISEICRATSTLGVVPTVMALSHNPEPKELIVDGVKVVRNRTSFEIASTRFSFSAPFTLNALVKDFDIVHYHFPWPFADLCQLALTVKKPYVVTYHSDIVKQKLLLKLYSPLMNSFLKGAARVVATSPNYVASSEVLSRLGSKVTVIPLALSPESYPKVSEENLAAWRERIGHDPFFLFVGVLRYYKGLHLLIEAVRGTSLKVVIVGAGPEEQKLKALARGLSNVIFLGRLSEVDKVALMSLAYAFVFPSHLRSEAFGMSLLEAGLFGLPSIAFDLGTGTGYVIESNVTGLLIDFRPLSDPSLASNALRNSMLVLLQSPQDALLMGAAAKARVIAMFNVVSMAAAYRDVYQQVLLK
jgi:O-antigen biosynthesis rhamnosyltransferase